ncbi:MAG: PilZ domain-containing protein [Thermodesulfobacteriota bacterium]
MTDSIDDHKRLLERKHTTYYFDVLDRGSGELVGRTVDITSEGLMLVSEAPIELNKIFELKLIIPFEVAGSNQIEFDAESHWGKPDVNPEHRITGFKFTKITPEEITKIKRLAEEYSFKD